MRNAEHTFSGSAIPGDDSFADLLHELRSLRKVVPCCCHAIIVPVRGFSHILHNSTTYEVFADTANARIIKARVVTRLKVSFCTTRGA